MVTFGRETGIRRGFWITCNVLYLALEGSFTGVYFIIIHFSVHLHFMQLLVFLLYCTIRKTLKKKKEFGPPYGTPLKHPLSARVLNLSEVRNDIKSIHPSVKAMGTGYPHSFTIGFLEREAWAGQGPTSSAISLKVAKGSCSSPSRYRKQ